MRCHADRAIDGGNDGIRIVIDLARASPPPPSLPPQVVVGSLGGLVSSVPTAVGATMTTEADMRVA